MLFKDQQMRGSAAQVRKIVSTCRFQYGLAHSALLFINLFSNWRNELRSLLEQFSGAPAIGIGLILMFFVMLVVCTLFGMLGGLFGALMFRKAPSQVVPPPIPPVQS